MSGNVTDIVKLQYLKLHSERKPTGINREWISWELCHARQCSGTILLDYALCLFVGAARANPIG